MSWFPKAREKLDIWFLSPSFQLMTEKIKFRILEWIQFHERLEKVLIVSPSYSWYKYINELSENREWIEVITGMKELFCKVDPVFPSSEATWVSIQEYSRGVVYVCILDSIKDFIKKGYEILEKDPKAMLGWFLFWDSFLDRIDLHFFEKGYRTLLHRLDKIINNEGKCEDFFAYMDKLWFHWKKEFRILLKRHDAIPEKSLEWRLSIQQTMFSGFMSTLFKSEQSYTESKNTIHADPLSKK